MRKTIKHYVSDIDIFLKEYMLLKPRTKSEKREIDKDSKIAKLRDQQKR